MFACCRILFRTNTKLQSSPSPSNARSPLSPGSGSSGTPISFQPNVNRSKTKRWVEARQYSYDGGDWGDDDDEEEEEEEAPPPVPRAPYAAQHNGSSSELSSRRLDGIGFGADESAAKKNSGGEQKALPFVRPAELYKRMREEKASQSPVADGTPAPSATEASPQTTQQPPSVELPEVKRMSSFGADFMGGADSTQPENTSTAQPELQHNPSAGYRSVVHQAFDVPQTPQSTTTSVERSNSDSTSVISPIIGSRAVEDERTPTIFEEPNEASSPRETAKEGPVFQPGHRRDLSLPSSENSPSRRPQVTDQETPTGDRAEISVIPQPTHDIPHPSSELNTSTMQPYSIDGQDRPAPLKFGSASGPDSYHGAIPTIMGAEDSPQNTDNDRLREEIIQSLSREATPSEEPEQRNQSQAHAPAESIPQQFEKYWSPTETPQALVSDNQPDLTDSQPLAPQNPYANSQGNSSTTIVDQPKKGKLERRFSWESSDGEGPEPQIPGSYASPPHDATLSMQEPEPIAEDTTEIQSDVPRDIHSSDNEGSDSQRAERPRLSIVPPVPENASPPRQVSGPGTIQPQESQVPSITKNSSLDESQLLGFRDIIGITSINQRIKSFEHTRDQFSTLDTGLSQWLQFMAQEHSEHMDVVQKSQTLSPAVAQSSPSRSRFPKLPSLGNLGSSNADGTPTSGSHMRRPSAHLGSVVNRQIVGDKGKEFLHTAGAFSGKASGAAKGLFAKGRSKFRPSGGSDKVDT